jgi:hypothetical protein
MKEKRDLNYKTGISIICMLVFIVMLLTSINACGFLGIFGEASWKEEVLLHDGSKIIVKRWQKHGGRHSLGDRPPMQEYTLKFKLPHTNETIIWKDGPTEDIEFANFDLLALHIKNNIPYLITSTRGCLAYSKWGRPNPPYVIFKYEGNEWKRIPLSELPVEFENINLVINATGHEKELISEGLVPATMVNEINKRLTQKEYKTIVRIPIKKEGPEGCLEMIYSGNGTWMSLNTFEKQASREACAAVCIRFRFKDEYCPCNKLFKTKTKEK